MLAYHGQKAQDLSSPITLRTEYDPQVGLIRAVPQDLSRVFLNIVANGCSAVLEKKKIAAPGFIPELSVRSRNLGDQVEVRIRDNGTGVPAAVREKIFQPFFTTKPPGVGTGLGLSISFDIVVRLHQGRTAPGNRGRQLCRVYHRSAPGRTAPLSPRGSSLLPLPLGERGRG